MLKQLNSDVDIENLSEEDKQSIENITYNIRFSKLTRDPCLTCQKWININKGVDDVYPVYYDFLPESSKQRDKTELLNKTKELSAMEINLIDLLSKDLLSRKKNEEEESNDELQALKELKDELTKLPSEEEILEILKKNDDLKNKYAGTYENLLCNETYNEIISNPDNQLYEEINETMGQVGDLESEFEKIYNNIKFLIS